MNTVLKSYKLSSLLEIESMTKKKLQKEITRVNKILSKGKHLREDKEILELFKDNVSEKIKSI